MSKSHSNVRMFLLILSKRYEEMAKIIFKSYWAAERAKKKDASATLDLAMKKFDEANALLNFAYLGDGEMEEFISSDYAPKLTAYEQSIVARGKDRETP